MNGDLNSWDKFCNYLWFDKKLNIWLDISKINFTNEEIKRIIKQGMFKKLKDGWEAHKKGSEYKSSMTQIGG